MLLLSNFFSIRAKTNRCQIPGAPKPAEHEEESLKFALFESEGQELVEALNVECERIKVRAFLLVVFD